MNQKSTLKQIESEFLALRDGLKTVHLATTAQDGQPEASYAPFLWSANAYYLYLSSLAKHSVNISHNPAISLLFIESEENSSNLFARKRIILNGHANLIQRNSELFSKTLVEFKHRFGQFIELIEPLEDFNLFQIKPNTGRFIRGFAQVYALSGDGLGQIKRD